MSRTDESGRDGLREAVERLAAEMSDRGGDHAAWFAVRLTTLLAEHPVPTPLTDDEWAAEAEAHFLRCACGALKLSTTASERHDRGLHGADRCVGMGWPR